MKLDGRLEACAGFVTGERVCDVGTDHGRLAAALLKSGRCKTAVASDLNKAPLSAAKATLERLGVSERAELVLSDGLLNIRLGGITDIVIAGMGGELIAKILSERACELGGVNLVLQPMTKLSFLRAWLSENGFDIINEKEATARNRRYTVINARLA
ncbi:MAG: class I SAM-dependent methyltransferase [Oscillospiraceae bacterium]|nr:class I SAM-dependent methyltransferase [Oscillospiraceae bacterium]